MGIKHAVWRHLTAGVMGTVAACTFTASLCHAQAKGADRPPGGRQFEFQGKLYPPYPRPTGKEPKFFQQYHYAHYWPYPQNCEDRMSVSNALSMQVANGWVEGTTLYGYHFDPETEQLNSAGMAHLEYILFRTPGQRRSVFIQMSNSAQTDQARMASVQGSCNSMLQGSNMPPIALRRARAYGTSAEEVDIITRKYIGTAPTPRLSVSGATSGGGGGGSGGGNNSNNNN